MTLKTKLKQFWNRLLAIWKSLNYPKIEITRRFDNKEYHVYADYASRELAIEERDLLKEQGKTRKFAVIRVGKKYMLYFHEG